MGLQSFWGQLSTKSIKCAHPSSQHKLRHLTVVKTQVLVEPTLETPQCLASIKYSKSTPQNHAVIKKDNINLLTHFGSQILLS